jgi:imidazolonepropionase-like amidohydrolase
MRGLPRPGAGVVIFLSLVFLLVFVPDGIEAQYDVPPPPAAWALEGVNLVHPDGTVDEGMTLVVRGGIIEALAAGAAVPDDARRIDWDEGTLHIYPGIIDAHGDVDLSLPTPDREGVESWSPTREVQFFTPHRVTGDFVRANGQALERHRERGIVASVVYPGRGIMPGQPSLVLHRPDARTPRELILRESLGVAMAFQGAQGAYPGTLMAQHAFIRQVFLDAEHRVAHAAAFESDPAGMPVAHRDDDLEIVTAMAAGEIPVYFRANGAEEIRRVLALADELGFSPVIVGGEGAGELAEELRDRDIMVLLNSRLPETDAWDPEDDEDELSPAAFRERQRLEPIYRTPALLAEHGVRFTFTTGGEGSADFLPGIRRAIEWGLDPDDALRALTAVPADFLGVPHLARVAEGHSATFIVTDGPIFDEGRRVNWTFINGLVEEGAAPRTAGEAEEAAEGDLPASELAGSWEGNLDVQGQSIPLRLELEVDGDDISGEIVTADGPATEIRNPSFDGSTLSFGVSAPEMGGMVIQFSGTLDGDTLAGSGSVDTPAGPMNLNFELRRVPGGELR